MKRSPRAAFWLSLLPGAGHVYVGQPLKGLVLILLVGAVIQSVDSGADGFGILIPFLWVYAMLDAHRIAQEVNHRLDTGQPIPRGSSDSAVGKWWGWALIALGAVFTLQNFGLFDLDWLFDLWPVGLIGLGVFILRRPPVPSPPPLEANPATVDAATEPGPDDGASTDSERDALAKDAAAAFDRYEAARDPAPEAGREPADTPSASGEPDAGPELEDGRRSGPSSPA